LLFLQKTGKMFARSGSELVTADNKEASTRATQSFRDGDEHFTHINTEMQKKYRTKPTSPRLTIGRGYCPICMQQNKVLVRYHVRYEKPIVILACKACNLAERCMRLHIGHEFVSGIRFFAVREYHKKLGIVV